MWYCQGFRTIVGLLSVEVAVRAKSVKELIVGEEETVGLVKVE